MAFKEVQGRYNGPVLEEEVLEFWREHAPETRLINEYGSTETVVGCSVYEVGAPLEAWLHYHHEMAYVGTSTSAIAFTCRAALPGRGATFVSDNVRATEAILETALPRKFPEFPVQSLSGAPPDPWEVEDA